LNDRGQFGNGTTTSSTTPVATGFSASTEISVGGNFVCARAKTGELQCAGSNYYGQLGAPVTFARNQQGEVVRTGIEQSSTPISTTGF
jgi:alpha-tubulin suppressor-like RCC1 family protein